MAYKIITPEATALQEPPKPEQSFGPERPFVATAAQVPISLGIIGDIGQAIKPSQEESQQQSGVQRLLGQALGHLPTTESITKRIQSALPEGYLKPKSPTEEIFHTAARGAIPTAISYFTGGGALLPLVLEDIVASTGIVGAEKAGLGPIGQLIGGFAGGKIANKAYNFATKTGNAQGLFKAADTIKQNAYAMEKKLGSQIKIPSQQYQYPYRKNTDSLLKKVENSGALKTGEKTELADKLKLLIKDTENPDFLASQLWERKKEINGLLKDASKRERPFYKQINGLIQDEIEHIGKSNREWYNAGKLADEIHTAQNYRNMLSEALHEAPYIGKYLTNPYVQAVTGIATGGGLGGLTGAAAGLGVSAGFRAGELLYGFYSQPQTKKLLKDSIYQMATNDFKRLAQTFSKLNNEANKYEEKIKKEKPKSKKYRIERP